MHEATSRTETDSMGAMQVPAAAYYGAQTARAVENFPISPLRFPEVLIKALGMIKKHAAGTNEALGLLPTRISQAIQQAAQEVADGKWDAQFVVDIFQTGSGTSTNMNANEVIANRASELLGGRRGDKSVHPNDHVNLGQSSNDVIPTAIHLAALDLLENQLLPALAELQAALLKKSLDFKDVLKIGRTHLQDATPIRLGQEFSGYASQVWPNWLWAARRSGRASIHTRSSLAAQSRRSRGKPVSTSMKPGTISRRKAQSTPALRPAGPCGPSLSA
jgi:fumarate hydratase class II